MWIVVRLCKKKQSRREIKYHERSCGERRVCINAEEGSISKSTPTRLDVLNMLKLVEEFNLTPHGWVLHDSI